MDAIRNNPFRILGLPTTASDKEIAKRVSDLLIYAEMGKEISYDTDFPFLGKLDRSVESIKLASNRIELPENKIFYSLLCFDLKDNFEKDSIEFVKKGDFNEANNILKKAIEENSPDDFITWNGKDRMSLLKEISIIDNDDYSIQKAIPPSNLDIATYIFYTHQENKNIIIKYDFGVDIIETYSKISFNDRYQIGFVFRWISSKDYHEKSLGIKLRNYSNEEYLVEISTNGKLKIYKSNTLEFEKVIDEGLLNNDKNNTLAIQRYDKYIEVKLNENSIYKIETNEIFQSFLLCFFGEQKVYIDDLFISGLLKKDLGTGAEINEMSFSYNKNSSIIKLLKIFKNNKINMTLASYLHTIGDFFKEPYFITYTKKVISNNYKCDFAALTDIFIRELYFSLYHLVDPNEQDSQFKLHGSFQYISKEAELKVKEMSMGYKPNKFDIFITEIASKRIMEPSKAYDFACELKNEAISFFNWYSEFYNFHNLIYKSFSDKVGLELTECAISYYNASIQKKTEHAKVALNVLTWASDFSFNQALRERINDSISILLKTHPNTEYKIIDFEYKDRTRSIRRIIPKDKPAETKTNNAPTQKTNNVQSSKTSKTISNQFVTKEFSKSHQEPDQSKYTKLIKILKNTYGILLVVLLIISILFVLLSPFN